MNGFTYGLTIFTSLALISSELSAEVVVSFTPSDVSGSISPNFGQSVTTPNTVKFRDISFNFFTADLVGTLVVGDPLAEGELFLLTSEYLGAPEDLSSSTPGFVAQTTTIRADRDGTEWSFDSDVLINPDTQYFFYARTSSFIRKAFSNSDAYPDGAYYESGNASSNFTSSQSRDWFFELEGTAVAVPEPVGAGSLSLLLGVGLLKRRRRYTSS